MSPTGWVCEGPLDLGTGLWVSRALEAGRLLERLRPEGACVFVWSPPKCGTTTFFAELCRLAAQQDRLAVRIVDARQELDPSAFEAPESAAPLLLVIDELEDLGRPDDVEKFLQQAVALAPPSARWVLAGDNRAWKRAREIERFRALEDFSLGPMLGDEIARRLVAAPLAEHERHLDLDAAKQLCEAAAGNLYLIQRLAEAFWGSIQERSDRAFGTTQMLAFLAAAADRLRDYFDDLTRRILQDDEAPYAIIDLLEGGPREPSPSLRGLGITAPDGRSFASKMFEQALRERCTALKFARRFAEAGNWAKAVEFYKLELSLWKGTRWGKVEILEEAVNACFAARTPLDFVSLARQLSHDLPPDRRIAWLTDPFLPQVSQLLDQLPEKEYQRTFQTLVEAVDTIARTGRGRLYLADSKGERLLCRRALGTHGEEFERQPITVNSRDWKATDVYLSGDFADVPDPKRDKECQHDMARRTELESSWLFPIVPPPGPGTPHEPVNRTMGVFCVDNPHHAHDRPGELERDLIGRLLRRVAKPLLRAKTEADRSDLQFRIERLTSLHQHLMTDHPAEQILHDLLKVAQEIQPNLSIIVIRLVQGYRLNRLGLATCWPKEKLGPVLEKAGLDRIDVGDSVAAPEDEAPVRYVYDVHDETERSRSKALDRLIRALEEGGIDLPIGSLLSFRLETPREYLGMCNFYTSVPYGFSEDEKEALAMIVKQAAVALYNSQQIAAMGRQHMGLQILANCIALVNEMADPSKLTQVITQRFGELFGVSSSSFVSVDQPSHSLHIDCTWPQNRVVGGASDVLEWGEGVTGWAIESGETKVVSSKDNDWSRFVTRVADIHCCAAVLIKDLDGKVVGALALETEQEDAFTPADIQLIETVVAQVPLATTNAKLVSDLRAANQRLESQRWSEAMGASVAQAVHRVANIVGAIPARANDCKDLLAGAQFWEGKQSAEGLLTDIVKSADRMLLIAQHLNRSGAGPKNITTVDLVALVTDVVRQRAEGNVSFKIEGVQALTVTTDPQMVSEIIECLLENAMAASVAAKSTYPERIPMITTRVEVIDARTVGLYVTDTGIGIPPSLKEQLCRTVVQSGWGRGTTANGIGLFVSGRQAYVLGGQLKPKHTDEFGTTFELTLPMCYAGPNPQPARKSP